jgi:hypothetical protein
MHIAAVSVYCYTAKASIAQIESMLLHHVNTEISYPDTLENFNTLTTIQFYLSCMIIEDFNTGLTV